MLFTSDKDWLYRIIIWGSIGVLLILSVYEFKKIVTIHPLSIVTFIITYGCAAFLMWIWFGTSYKLENHQLIIKYGPFKKVISVESITSIRFAKNPFTGAVLSMDKLEIMYDKFEVMTISPKHKHSFIEELTAKNPSIHILKNNRTS